MQQCITIYSRTRSISDASVAHESFAHQYILPGSFATALAMRSARLYIRPSESRAMGVSRTVIWYYFSGVLVSVLPAVFFFVNHCRGGLDQAYRRHHRLTPHASLVNVQALAPTEEGIDVQLQADPPRCPCLSATTNEKAFIIRYSFLCQVCLIGLNISLTPLANVLAHGKFKLGQEIVLLKLLGDFVGRVLFFCLPAPRRLRLHLGLNWVVAALRLPVWLVLEPWFSDPVLLAIWMPFVVSAAFGGSWLQVLAIQAADEQEKRATAARMNMAVYYGFVSGVAFAAVFAFVAEYQPGKVNFQNDSFERPQLLALCEKLVHSGQEALSKGPKRPGKENLQMCAESPSRVQARLGTSCGSRHPKDDRASTATTKAPATAESRLQNLGCCSPPWTSESQRLPTLKPLTARA
eukprot:s1796_g10.t1